MYIDIKLYKKILLNFFWNAKQKKTNKMWQCDKKEFILILKFNFIN